MRIGGRRSLRIEAAADDGAERIAPQPFERAVSLTSFGMGEAEGEQRRSEP